jgi:hypothetical protein
VAQGVVIADDEGVDAVDAPRHRGWASAATARGKIVITV